MDETNNLVSDLLNILQSDVKETNTDKKAKPAIQSGRGETQKDKKITKEVVKKASSTEGFLAEIDETIKNTQYAKVVIRKDLYEVFMSIKRAKQVKSVSTLLDYALEDYIKRNSDNIKKLLNESYQL